MGFFKFENGLGPGGTNPLELTQLLRYPPTLFPTLLFRHLLLDDGV